jgi:two-component system, OmpR family, phosphate regulon sensor histidine kinase PhoR
MNQFNLGRLFAVWCALMLSLPIGTVWLGADILETHRLAAGMKLAVLLAATSASGLVVALVVSRRWSSRLQQFNQFAAAFPGTETELAVHGPPELETLGRAMQGMAERVRSIVERVNVEASRRDTVLACMAEGVLAVDNQLRVVFCNGAFAAAFRTRIPPREGIFLYELVREPLLRDILEHVLKAESGQTGRFQLPSAEGGWFEARALPFGSSRSGGAVVVLHDITDIQRQEQLRKDFVADVSHELRTPLAAIRGYAETLLDGGLEDHENNRRFLEIILAHTIRLNDIASDLLVLSELDSETGPAPALSPVSIFEVFESAANSVRPAAETKGIRIDGSGCERHTLMGLRFRLEQVLVNLLDNAVKFNRPGGQVKVECKRSGRNEIQISVSDTGIGIPSGDTAKIFERFYRVDKARSRPAGGTGLGLPIVKEIVTRMAGTINVESQLGRGSKFIVTLPGLTEVEKVSS